jgi:hypothetical protein
VIVAAKRSSIRGRKLDEFEREFDELLIPCLRRCAQGRWGLFGAYDRIKQQHPGMARRLSWPEADRLRELAAAILSSKAEFGAGDWCCEEFLRLCSLHRANDPGEPKLAASFLKQIEARRATPSSELR